MQSPPPLKLTILGFCSQFFRIVLKRMKKLLSDYSDFLFLRYDSKCFESSQKKIAHMSIILFVRKDAQYSGTNAELIFRFLQFLVFEIWLLLYSKFLVNWGL